jgi:serine protease inhibitor
MSPDVAASLAAAAADDAFGADLYRLLAAGPGNMGSGNMGSGNMVFSPVSIAAALRMALLGARGETAAQMAAALHLASPQDAGGGLRLLSARLAALAGNQVTLHAPNTMWVQAGLPLRPEYTGALDGMAGAMAGAADFAQAAEQARQHINQVIAGQTAGKIPALLPPHAVGPRTLLVLANAIYLKAAWAQPFPAAATASAPFYLAGGGPGGGGPGGGGPGGGGPGGAGPGGGGPGGAGPGGAGPGGAGPGGSGHVDVPMMRRTARLGYLAVTGYQAVTVPYASGSLMMAIILPDGPLGPLEERLTAGGLRGLLAGVTPEQVKLALPRFKTTAAFGLGPSLTSLGMAVAFDRRADFSGITTAEPLHIGVVAHQAYLDVDERGTEAAAATAVGMVRVAAVRRERPPIVVTVDRPFLFAITDAATKLPLFLGRVTNPLAG